MAFEGMGIVGVTLTEVIAFTPTAVALKAIESALDGETSEGWTKHLIDQRMSYSDDGEWSPEAALPCHTGTSLQVLTAQEDRLSLRLLRDGTCTLSRNLAAQPEDLVARRDSHIEGAHEFLRRRLEMPEGSGPFLMDDVVGFPLQFRAPYPVAEVEVTDGEVLRRLIAGDRTGPESQKLDELLMYMVARNYWLSDEIDETSLGKVSQEVLPEALYDDRLLKSEEGRYRLRNLSQGTRIFIAFGRRGTVVVHTRSIETAPIRASVLNMVETLRSRFQNLLVASTLMDRLLRQLAQLEARDGNTAEVEAVLRTLETATYIYGLAVTDPSVQLLDGSILSEMADRAESYFDLQSLRQSCQRKMDAIRTIWTSYLDRRRQVLLRHLQALPREAAG